MDRGAKRQKETKTKKRLFWIVYCIILVALFVAVQIVPRISDKMTDTSIIKVGDLKISEDAKATVVRDDKVFFCKTDCSLEPVCEEDTQVKVGTQLFKYKTLPSKGEDAEKPGYDNIRESLSGYYETVDDGLAKSKGVFSMNVDGSEAYFSPSNIDAMRENNVNSQIRNNVPLKRKKALAGEPIYKISNNSRWYLIFWTDREKKERYEPGQVVDVMIQDWKVKCRIESVTEEDSRYKVVLSTNRYYKDFTKQRQMNIEVISMQASGLLVKNEDIIRRNRQEGVFVVDQAGNRHFTPIKRITTDGKMTVVSEDYFFDQDGNSVKTVQVFDEILSEPD